MAAAWGGRTTAALVLAVAVLSGCSSEEPANETLPSASAEPSATADALPPLGPPDFPVPDEAREKTPEGALEFTRYYIGLIEWASNGPQDPQPLLDLTDTSCATCDMIAESFRNDLARGYRYSGVTFNFHAYASGVLTEDQAQVAFVFSQSAIVVSDASGQSVPSRSTEPSGDLQSGARLTWNSALASWIVDSLTIG
jgi:hypothetical protein